MTDDEEFDCWQEYKTRRMSSKHTYRSYLSILDSNKTFKSNMKQKKMKYFNIIHTQHNRLLLRDQFLEEINLFDSAEYLNESMYMIPGQNIANSRRFMDMNYSLNKKKRWLLPHLIDSMDNFKAVSTETHKTIWKNSTVKTIELIEKEKEKENLDSISIDNTCSCSNIEYRYKRGNCYVKVIKDKKTKKNCETKIQIEEKPRLIFDFNFGFSKLFQRRSTICEKKINKRNFKFKRRRERNQRMMDEYHDVCLVEKKKKLEKKRYNILFYVLKKKILPKIRTEDYKIDFIHGNKSFTDTNTIKNEFLKDLLKSSSTSTIIKSPSAGKNSLSCSICFENFSCLLSLEKCQHTACHRCWINYLNTVIECFKVVNGSTVKPIGCIQQDCGTILGLNFLSRILKDQSIEKYKQFYYEMKLLRSRKYTLCPTNNCDKIMVKNSQISTTICNCNYMMCNLCRQESHFPLNCEDFRIYRQNYQFTGNPITQGKFCPKCSRYIEKNGGCNHMKCLCGHNFCWICSSASENHRTCVQTELISYDVDFFQGNIEPEVYRYLFEQRGIKSNFDGIGEKQIEKNVQFLSKSDFYKSFKIYISDILSSVDLDLLVRNIFVEIFFCLKQFIYFCEYSIYMHYNLKRIQQRVSIELIRKSCKTSKKFSFLFFNAKNHQDFILMIKMSKCIKSILKHV
jgi:hypothetical protein